MNFVFKVEILRYGEFVEFCYDVFDDRYYFEYYGMCKYSKCFFFGKMGFGNFGYEIIKYIYVNIYVLGLFFGERLRDEGVWIGFIVVCIDLKEIKRLG